MNPLHRILRITIYDWQHNEKSVCYVAQYKVCDGWHDFLFYPHLKGNIEIRYFYSEEDARHFLRQPETAIISPGSIVDGTGGDKIYMEIQVI